MVGFIVLVSVWVPFLDTAIARRWFTWPNIAYLSPMPLLVAACTFWLYRAVQKRYERIPFILAMTLFLLNYTGLVISIWPNIVPPATSIWAAASPTASQLFLLAGTVALIPIILTYTAYSYWIFWGKITRKVGYYVH